MRLFSYHGGTENTKVAQRGQIGFPRRVSEQTVWSIRSLRSQYHLAVADGSVLSLDLDVVEGRPIRYREMVPTVRSKTAMKNPSVP